ncbi:sulfatase family protein [Polaribacter gangjinensis]|nr:sulfatase-like hydrolase/transferase [Polaribacter gangjinensis]
MKILGKIFVLLFFIYHNLSAQNNSKPNIIFIMTDDHSPIVPKQNDIKNQSRPFGFNGETKVHTPIIDDLAKNGMIFTRAYVSSSVCSPSRYTALTGRYAGRSEGKVFLKQHPIGSMTRVENNVELEMDRDNLPRLLQKAGYKTGFVGKSHVIEHDLVNQRKNWVKNGFKEYDKDADPNHKIVSEAMAFNHQKWTEIIKKYGFDYANAIYAANLKELHNDSINVHNVEWKNKAALDFIDKNKNSPFYLYYSETIPHGPAPWIKNDGMYVFGLDANPKFTGEGYKDMSYSYLPTRAQILEEVKKLDKDVAHAWLRWFDYAVGAIVKKLKDEGIYENTLIVIASDHGDYNGGKTTLYEGGTKIPLMMHWPNGIKPNQTYDELVQNIDFAPTFLDLAGVNFKKSKNELNFDGVSLKNVLNGSKHPVHEYLFFELGFARGVMTKNWKYIAVRYDQQTQRNIEKGIEFKGWKGVSLKYPYYVRNGHLGNSASQNNELYFEPNQLFNLENDPYEKTNLFSVDSTKAKEMKNVLTQFLKSFKERPFGEFIN